MTPDVRVTWFDRFLIAFAPQFALKRIRARATATAMVRHYNAAGSGRRVDGWHRRSTDANAAASGALVTLRELSRDLRRNGGWPARGIQVIANNVVGWGIEPKAAGVSSELAARALDLWQRWANVPACDYDGRMPFRGIQRLAMKSIVESGEVLIVRERANSSDGLPVPLRVRVLEGDYLDHARDGLAGPGGGPIVQGIELDGRGRRVAYWLYEHHPGGNTLSSATRTRFESQRVPAEDVIHIYRVDRPGQMRGIPWLATAIAKLHDLEDYDDAKLMQAKIAACFAAFVTDYFADAPPMGKQDPQDPNLETLEPGQIEYLPPGKQVTFAQPPGAPEHKPVTESALRQIAAGLGITYEDLTGDYSRVNFSSARMARLAHWANVYEWRWDMVIPHLCASVWDWVMEDAAVFYGWPDVPRSEWAAPPMPMLEPDKEGLAYTRLVRSGAMTLYQAIRERGEDPETHLREYAEGNKRLDALGIVLDSDARKVSASGLAQPDEADAAEDGSDAGQDEENEEG